jgi:oligoendopeptidase F
MPKSVDVSKLVGNGSQIQTELDERIKELIKLKEAIELFDRDIVPRELAKIKRDLNIELEHLDSLSTVNKNFKELKTSFNTKINSPFYELIKRKNNTLEKNYAKFKENIKDLSAEYNFLATCNTIDSLSNEFDALKEKLQIVVEKLSARLEEFEKQLLPHEARLQIKKMQKAADKLSNDIVALAKKQADLKDEQLDLNDLLASLQGLTNNSKELQTPRLGS